MKALLLVALFALFSLSGCVSLKEKRALYMEAHPDLAGYKVDALLKTPAEAVPGMTVEEVKLVLGIYRRANHSDGTTVYRSVLGNVLLYFDRGQLSYWSNFR